MARWPIRGPIEMAHRPKQIGNHWYTVEGRLFCLIGLLHSMAIHFHTHAFLQTHKLLTYIAYTSICTHTYFNYKHSHTFNYALFTYTFIHIAYTNTSTNILEHTFTIMHVLYGVYTSELNRTLVN